MEDAGEPQGLLQRLKRSIKAFGSNDFSDALELFKILKATSNLTAENIETARKWTTELWFQWCTVSTCEEKRQSLFEAFGRIRSASKKKYQHSTLSGTFGTDSTLHNGAKRSVLSEVFAGTGPVEDKEFIKICKKAAETLMDNIAAVKADFARKAEQARKFIYSPIPLGDDAALRHYENMGNLLFSDQSSISHEMSQLAQTTYRNFLSPTQILPSFVVCSSFGAGKTQLPFSLDIPVLHFWCEPVEREKSIYNLFKNISTHFLFLLNDDFRTFTESIKNNVDKVIEIIGHEFSNKKGYVMGMLEYYRSEMFSMEMLNSLSCSFKTPSFLMALVEKITALANVHSSFRWPRLELMLSEPISPGTATLEEARAHFCSVIAGSLESNEPLKIPLIFLNEFHVDQNSTNESKAFNFFCNNLIRASGLIPVIMGSNWSMAEMQGFSRSREVEPQNFLYIFYRLPKYPEVLFFQNVDSLLLEDKQKGILKSFSPLLRNERPLFIEAIFEQISQYLKDNLPLPESTFEWLEFIMAAFQSTFMERLKRISDNFFIYPGHLFNYSYKQKCNGSDVYVSPHLIRPYLANLKAPEDIQPQSFNTFFKIYHMRNENYYQGKKYARSYEPCAELPTFSDSPLTCMAFSQNINDKIHAFGLNSNACTAFEAVFKSAKLRTQSPSYFGYGFQFNEANLTLIVGMALMVSSHTNFLTGMPFKEWFEYFIQQLSCSVLKCHQRRPKKIHFDSSFWPTDEIIPYFAFNAAQWSEEFLELMKGDERIKLGTYSEFFREAVDIAAVSCSASTLSATRKLPESDSRDAQIYSGDAAAPSNPILLGAHKEQYFIGSDKLFSIECKLTERTLTRVDVRTTIVRMTECKALSRFNLLVAREISSNIAFGHDPRYFEGKFRMGSLSAQRSRATESGLEGTFGAESSGTLECTNYANNQSESREPVPFPYDNVSIFRLVRKSSGTKMTNAQNPWRIFDCLYNSPQCELHLKPIYDCGSKAATVFILIDLTEIYGEYLRKCVCYFKD